MNLKDMELEKVELNDLLVTEKIQTELNGEVTAPEAYRLKCVKKQTSFTTKMEGIIANLISGNWYANLTDPILDIVDDLTQMERIEAVGIIDTEGKVMGIIPRERLLKTVSRPFGKDLLSRQQAKDVMNATDRFLWSESVYTVAEQIKQNVRYNQHYLVEDENQQYIGTFSTWDLMLFLSSQTTADIQLAQKIQTSLIRELHSIRDKGYELAYSSSMAKGVGGDFIGLKQNIESRMVVCLCDVAGKGIAASLISASLAGILESFDFKQGIKSFLRLLNDFLLNTFGSEKYVTGAFAEFNPGNRKLTVFDMGHGHMAFFRDGKLASLSAPVSNQPLGITPEPQLRSFTLSLHPEDIFLLYSDGLTEQECLEGTPYSLSRLKPYLKKDSSQSLQSSLVRIWEDFHAFRGSAPQMDDVTLLLLRVN